MPDGSVRFVGPGVSPEIQKHYEQKGLAISGPHLAGTPWQQSDEPHELSWWERLLVDGATSVCPGVSDARHWQEVVTGYDIINQEELGIVERGITLAGAILPFVPGRWLRLTWDAVAEGGQAAWRWGKEILGLGEEAATAAGRKAGIGNKLD